MGEAKVPGPYTEGGATGSATGWRQVGHGLWKKHEGAEKEEGEAEACKRARHGEAERRTRGQDRTEMGGESAQESSGRAEGPGRKALDEKRGRHRFDDSDADPFEYLDEPEHEEEEVGPPRISEDDAWKYSIREAGHGEDEEEEGPARWWRTNFESGRDQSEDPHIEEMEQYAAPLPSKLGEGVPLPTDRLWRQWQKQKEEERDSREARWKSLCEEYGAEAARRRVDQPRVKEKAGNEQRTANATEGANRLAAISKGDLPCMPRIQEEEGTGGAPVVGKVVDKGSRDLDEQKTPQSGRTEQGVLDKPKRTRGRRSAKTKGSRRMG